MGMGISLSIFPQKAMYRQFTQVGVELIGRVFGA